VSAKSAAVSAGAVVATVLAGTGLAFFDSGSARPATAQSQLGSSVSRATPAPGTDPKIQRWFLLIEKSRVAFNNVLLKAEVDIKSGAGTANCSALLTATTVIENHLSDLTAIPNGGPAMAAAYLTPMDEFAKVATACKASDFAGARTLLGDTSEGAIADYGQAQDAVDEILDAGA
jgi:hypothetical protein